MAMQRLVPLVLAATLFMVPLDAQGVELVVWWEKGFYAEEDEALKENHRRLRASDRQPSRAGLLPC
jgi:hypothetical protein